MRTIPATSDSWGWMGLLWRRFSWRHICQSPMQSVILVILLSMGVGVFFAIRLANRAAVASFQNFTDVLTTESDGLIQAPIGTLPESVLGELRGKLGTSPVDIIPVLESTAAQPRIRPDEAIGSRRTYSLVGLDLIALQNLAGRFRRSANSSGTVDSAVLPRFASKEAGQSWDGYRDPDSIFISPTLAARQGLKLGDRFPLIVQERIVSFRIAGWVPTDPSRPQPPPELILLDLPALQHQTGLTGQLSRIEFLLEEGPDRLGRWKDLRRQLEALGNLSADTTHTGRWLVSSPGERRAGGEMMTRAFRLNLTLLSLLALLVGLYLVFQALDGAVVRRREEIAILRSLGVTSRAIQRAWLGEAAMLGLVGGILGLALGWIGAQGAVRLVGRTVNALYYASSAEEARLYPLEIQLALLVSVLTSLVAGWLPARSAAETPPAQSLGRGHATTFTGPMLLRRKGIALGLVLMGCIGLMLPPWRMSGGLRIPVAAYIAALCWTFAGGILGGVVLEFLSRGVLVVVRLLAFRRARHPSGREAPTNGVGPIFSTGAVLRLGLSPLCEPSGRHRLAVAGLVCAVSMTAGMAILVGSFDNTMRGWIHRTFQADLYVSSDGAQSASTENRISPEVWRSLVSHPAVARAQILQATRLQLPEGETLLVGTDLGRFREFSKPVWHQAPEDDAVFQVRLNSQQALVSEAFSERFRVRRGDSFEVPTREGNRLLTVAGVFRDYGNERGSILLERSTVARWLGHDFVSSLILQLKPGIDVESVRGELRMAHPGLAVFTQSYLRGEALRIFHQTFSITYALEWIGVLVAVAGLGFTMVSLLWERRGDLTTLRALGLSRHELAAATALECVITAVSGTSVGLVTSLGLGWLLIHRVNQQTFGWTLETDWPWTAMSGLGSLVVLAAAITGAWVGSWGAQLPAEQEE